MKPAGAQIHRVYRGQECALVEGGINLESPHEVGVGPLQSTSWKSPLSTARLLELRTTALGFNAFTPSCTLPYALLSSSIV